MESANQREGIGEAGRQGEGTRSDLHVSVELGGQGLRVEVRSKVALYYGDAIKAQAADVLTRLGVEAAQVIVDDQGALPFAIAARVESAARRAGISPPNGSVVGPEGCHATGPSSAKDALRRSRLYLPGNEPSYMVNAGLTGADGVILDLEDSVHPSQKDAARIMVRRALDMLDFGHAERMVRINQLPVGLVDLEEVVAGRPDLILIPKVESPEQVDAVAQKLAELSPNRDIWLMPIIESALGMEYAFEIAKASTLVVAVTIGLEDYTADLGVRKTVGGEESLWARQRLVNAARAAGCQSIDSVFGDVGDLEGLESWARRSRAMGFEGMGCVHPRQIEVIHQAFAPQPEEVDRARRIVAAFEDAQSRGLAVVSLGSKMIDPPVVARAMKLVDRAEKIAGEAH